MSSVRNTDKPRGPAITLAEVVSYAKRNCRVCGGTGVMRRRLAGENTFQESACGCAAMNWDRLNPGAIVTPDGSAYWPAPVDAHQTSQDDVGEAIPPPVVHRPHPTVNVPPTPSHGVQRMARLQAEFAKAEEEAADVRGLMTAETQEYADAIRAQEDLVLSLTGDLGQVDYRALQVEAQIRDLKEKLAALEEVRTHLRETEAPPISDAIDVAWSVIGELKGKVQEAGAHLRPRQRKAMERLAQLDKRIGRLQAEIGGER